MLPHFFPTGSFNGPSKFFKIRPSGAETLIRGKLPQMFLLASPCQTRLATFDMLPCAAKGNLVYAEMKTGSFNKCVAVELKLRDFGTKVEYIPKLEFSHLIEFRFTGNAGGVPIPVCFSIGCHVVLA